VHYQGISREEGEETTPTTTVGILPLSYMEQGAPTE
jgi:hypothetical protein